MIQRSQQVWQEGEVVRVGFLQLRIVSIELTPGDYAPDAYHLIGLGDKADRKYRFVPHKGLERIN